MKIIDCCIYEYAWNTPVLLHINVSIPHEFDSKTHNLLSDSDLMELPKPQRSKHRGILRDPVLAAVVCDP